MYIHFAYIYTCYILIRAFSLSIYLSIHECKMSKNNQNINNVKSRWWVYGFTVLFCMCEHFNKKLYN